MKRRPTAILEDKHQALPDTDTAYVMDVSGQGLHAQFHRMRVIGGAVAVATIIGAIMIALRGDGVRIESFVESQKSDDDVKALVDSYNSISGSIGSFISKPVELFLGLLVSAAFLCFATDFTLDKSSVGHWQYVPVLTGAAVGYLFSNGINALNVQVVSGKIDIRMDSSDMSTEIAFEGQPMYLNGSIPMPWDRTYLESASGNAINNTIFHSMIEPFENNNAACNKTGFEDVREPLPSISVVSFGFSSTKWHSQVLTEALKPVKVLKVAMSKSVNELPSDSELPSTPSISRGLVNVGARVFNDLFHGTNQTDPPAVASTGTFMSAAHSTWLSVFNSTKGAIAKDATVEYSRFQLSSKITYDAVTFEVPVPVVQRNKFGTVVNPVNGSNEMYVSDYCSREGCLIPSAEITILNKTMTVPPRVQVTSICTDKDGKENDLYSLPPCDLTSLSSFRVVSIATRIEGDVWDMVSRMEGDVMRFKNLRTVYSITIGRIAWETEDLANVFGAECMVDDDNGGCIGVRYNMHPLALDEDSDYLVVSTSSSPAVRLSQYTSSGYDKWIYLVSGADGLGGGHYDVLRARNFANVTASGASLQTIAADRCNTYTDDYIRAVEKNHLYMEHSLQASYTAALFYLFQFGVHVDRDLPTVPKTGENGKKATTTTTVGDKPIYKFNANQQIMDVMVSVPTTNALVSLSGCLVILAVSIGIVMLAKKSEQRLESRANVAIVTEAMLNNSKYPPWLLNLALEQAAAVYTQEQQEHGQPPQEERLRVMLQDLRVQSVNLHHNKIADHAFVIGSDMDKS